VSKGSKKPQTHAVDFSFQSYQWYMLTVVYVHHRLKSSELCCYVNGKAVMNAEVNLPNTDDVREREGGSSRGRERERENEGGLLVPIFRSMINAFLEALQALEKT
jgi:hypothetical protein